MLGYQGGFNMGAELESDGKGTIYEWSKGPNSVVFKSGGKGP
jgi:hypothetical protein